MAKTNPLECLFLHAGTWFAVGNTFLFSQNGGLSFIVAAAVLALCVMMRLRSSCDGVCPLSNSKNPQVQKFIRFMKHDASPFIANGIGCVLTGLLALRANAVYGVICGFGFGIGNFLIARQIQCADTGAIDDKVCDASCCCALKSLHPTLFIGAGLISAGLYAGGHSLWALPVALMGVVWSVQNLGVKAYAALAAASAWYTIVGLASHNSLAMLANLCFTIGYVFLLKSEQKLTKI